MHIIVVGNEKGGSGKSTTAMHLATALARQGRVVGCLDLDLRQRSLGRYIENRAAFVAQSGVSLAVPVSVPLPEAVDETAGAQDARIHHALERLLPHADFAIIDCPGSHTRLSQAAHALADTLVTPLNDSFVDFDLLARTEPGTGRVLGPSVYAEMVWRARQIRTGGGLPAIDWVVVRNRLGTQAMHNKRRVGAALERLAKRIGFRIAPGFADRVVFRELFPQGLTLLDLGDAGLERRLTLSHVAARQELRALVAALALPGVAPVA